MSYRLLHHLVLLVTISMAIGSCNVIRRTSKIELIENEKQEERIYALKNVNIIPMTPGNTIIKNGTVVIKDKKIFSINGAVPSKATIIDCRGKWLIPGLTDMHVHNLADINFSATYPTKGATLFADTQNFMLLYIANGVTTVFELNGRVEHFGQRNEIIKGNVIGPRIALAYLIDGGDAGNVANTPSEGRQTVRIAEAQGYEFIKLYSGLNIETYKAIIDEANKRGMKVVGHIPNAFRGRIKDAFVPHFNMVAHAEEYSKESKDLSDEDARRFAQLAKGNNTWLTPTLTTMERIARQTHSLEGIRNLPTLKYVHPLMQSKWLTANRYSQETDPKRIVRIDDMVNFHLRLVKAFKNAGVPIVVGTDAGVSGVVWGFSLHDEMELLIQAGLSTQEILASATILPATWLGLADKLGTVEVGKYADLVLLEANPLDDIKNARKINGVFVNGNWVSKEKIDVMLDDLEKWNIDNKNKFDWKQRNDY